MRRAVLFSGLGEPPLAPLVEAARSLIGGGAAGAGAGGGGIAYIPAASTRHDFFELNARAFAPVAPLRMVGMRGGEWRPSDEDRRIVEEASLIYIPGGNTYVLAERLARSGLDDLVLQRVDAGTPLLTFSAGTVLCGPSIVSTNDWNVTASRHFDGLGLVPLHLNVHFPPHDTAPDLDREDRIDQLLALRGEPVLGLEEAASLRVEGERCVVASGVAWLFTPGADDPRRLEVGAGIGAGTTA